MQKISAGLLMYRRSDERLEFFLVHPGGPFWKNKDEGAWSIPKGEVKNQRFLVIRQSVVKSKGEIDDEKKEMLDVAVRELNEETGIKIDKNKINFIYLGKVKQKSGKVVHCWAFEDKNNLWNGFFMRQNFIEIEWPLKSGKKIKIPEVDKAQYFKIEDAKKKINPAQKEFIERLKN